MRKCVDLIEKFYLSVSKDKQLLTSLFENKVFCNFPLSIQENILDVTLRHPTCLIYPPPLSFQKSFFRTLIEAIENCEVECSDSLVEAYADIMSKAKEETIRYHSYKIDEDCIITLKEHPCFVTNSTTGLQTWEASKYLTEWCIQNKPIIEDRTILELGCGIGLLGVATLKLCKPKKYIFTDKSWEVLKILSENLDTNFQNKEHDIFQQQVVWSNFSEEEASEFSPDVIFGADIVFDFDLIKDLVNVLKMLLKKKSSYAYIASTIRNPETNKNFIEQLDIFGLTYAVLENVNKSIFIYDTFSKFVIYKIYCVT